MITLYATKGKHERELIPIEKDFQEANTLLRGDILSVVGENIVYPDLSITTSKVWDALEAESRISVACTEL
jgi:hypothetical protein